MNNEMPEKAREFFSQACEVSRRLTLLSECLQDHLEDRPAFSQAPHTGDVQNHRAAIAVVTSDICSTGLQIVVALSSMLEQHLRHSGHLGIGDAVKAAGHDMLSQVEVMGKTCLDLTRIGLQSEREVSRFKHLLQLVSHARDVLAKVHSGDTEQPRCVGLAPRSESSSLVLQ